ncbi:TMM59-like protein [Mya arenaria]|uniref:TMM59-like protein n=1 Tax=Mya arenaria TaxID=6604 RepID=A0ABY7FPE8_MYAAR|nr:transmembrane protein 59-like [Mya arenaria]WAR22744.1 TMM59-like protein [Mya arenaria]
MAIKIICGCIFLLFLFTLASCDVFDSILDDVASCKQVCHNTFTPHTYEKSGSEECCNRGCRLFSMVEFIYDDVNKTTEVCIASCTEAYTETDDFEACKLGCKSQKPFALDNLLKEDQWEQHIRLVDPFTYMHKWYSDVFNTVVSQASVSWTVYMKDGDGSVIVVKSPPQHRINDLDIEYNTGSFIETNLEAVDNSATPYLKNLPYKAQRNDDDIVRLSARDLGGDGGQHEEHTDWLSCVARKTGLPRLLLSWLLLMCAIVMVWLCLSAAVTAPEQKVYTEPQKLSINGDQEVIAALLAQGIKPSYPQENDDNLSSLPLKISVHRI